MPLSTSRRPEKVKALPIRKKPSTVESFERATFVNYISPQPRPCRHMFEHATTLPRTQKTSHYQYFFEFQPFHQIPCGFDKFNSIQLGGGGGGWKFVGCLKRVMNHLAKQH
jgi:hypothetical protein